MRKNLLLCGVFLHSADPSFGASQNKEIDKLLGEFSSRVRVLKTGPIRQELERMSSRERKEVSNLSLQYANDEHMHEHLYVLVLRAFLNTDREKRHKFCEHLDSLLREDVIGFQRVSIIRHLSLVDSSNWDVFVKTMLSIFSKKPMGYLYSDITARFCDLSFDDMTQKSREILEGDDKVFKKIMADLT